MRVLVEIADSGSMAGAARRLEVLPAVVTRIVKELEADLRASLIQRTTRKLSFTDAGRRYVERARSIVADADRARAAVDASRSEASGHLRILAPPALAAHQLTKCLASFSELHPDVTWEIVTPGAVGRDDDAFDLSLLVVPRAPDGDFVARLLACSDVVLCASPSYLERRGLPRHPSDLLGHATMFPPVLDAAATLEFTPSDGRGKPFHGDRSRRVERVSILRTTQVDVMYSAALEGLGIAALPSFVAHRSLGDGRLVQVLPQWHLMTLQVWATVPSTRFLPVRTRAMLEHLIDAFGGRAFDPWLNRPLARMAKAARGARRTTTTLPSA